MTRRSLPTRRLPARPHLDQLKRQAKELLEAYVAGEPAAAAGVQAHFRDPDPRRFALHDAQLVLARAYGFESWPKLKAFVDGVTVRRLVDAIRGGDIAVVQGLLKARPELARMGHANMQPLHFAVLRRDPEAVRLLMRHGANARDGVYPFRDATTPHALAAARGYDEIVRTIEAEEAQRRRADGLMPDEPTPLHRAAFALDHDQVARLLDAGADPNSRAHHGLTPLDAAAHRWWQTDTARAMRVITLLLERGGAMTPAAAVVLDGRGWLRAQHEAGTLTNHVEDSGGLLRIAVTHDRTAVLRMLLDFGFDPDERIRFGADDEYAESAGMPLQAAVILGRYEMAELLLARGADPNAAIYASGDPMYSAYERRDERMIALLERHGGIPAGTTAGLFGTPELAKRMLDGEAPYRVDGATGEPLVEQLLWGAAQSGSVETVRMALERVDWARDDPRWFPLLEQTLRHAPGDPCETPGANAYLTCFELLLERCDPNLRGRPTDNQQFGLTVLHLIVGRGKIGADERVAFATAAIERGARLDVRDNLLKSTPLGWACRWGQVALVDLFLRHGADPDEPDAEPWARPRAWASRMGHTWVMERLAM